MCVYVRHCYLIRGLTPCIPLKATERMNQQRYPGGEPSIKWHSNYKLQPFSFCYIRADPGRLSPRYIAYCTEQPHMPIR